MILRRTRRRLVESETPTMNAGCNAASKTAGIAKIILNRMQPLDASGLMPIAIGSAITTDNGALTTSSVHVNSTASQLDERSSGRGSKQSFEQAPESEPNSGARVILMRFASTKHSG